MNDETSGTFRCGTVAIVGRPNVGKSTLLNRMVGMKVSITSRKPQTTRHRIHGILTRPGAQLVFVDTPGYQTRHGGSLNRTLNRTVTQAVSDVDVLLFVVEAGKFSAGDRVVADLLPDTLPRVLVVNKSDLVPRDRLVPFVADLQAQYAFSAVVPVSARQGTQVETLLDVTAGMLPAGDAMFAEDEVTDRSERFLASELIREKVFRLLGDELPYESTVVIDKFEQEGRLRRIYATLLVERDSHKAIMIGEKGERLRMIGSAARVDMEKLFDGKVYLELWVKVKSGWADNEASLRAYGYE